jgi:Ca-activated chloride channel family protein
MTQLRTYRVFSHVTGLVLFEMGFWALVVGMYFLVRRVAPQFELHLPQAWPALLIPLAALLLFAGHYRWKQRRMARSIDLELAHTLWPEARPRRSVWKFLLWRTGVALMAMGMLAPKMGTRLKEVEAKGVDIMMALDVSRSMMTEDLGMSRLDLAKRTIERVVARLDGDRAGLVVFAGDAYVQAPLTLDLSAVKLFLDAIGPDAIPVQGTAIGSAIELCQESFDSESQASRVILILTDGENHEDDALARAGEAANESIQVHALGMASEGGGPIPEFDRYGRQTGYKEDGAGQPVVSTLDERMLVAMAEAGNGTYVRANTGFVDLDPFLESLIDLDTGETSKVAYTDYVHHFPWFFLAGWILLMLEAIWPSSPMRKSALAAVLLLFMVQSEVSAQSRLETGTKAEAVAGTEAMLERNYALADSLFGAAEGWNGAKSGQIALNRGMALAGEGNNDGALKAFQRAAMQSEDRGVKSDAWNNVGNLLLGSEDVEGAIEAYKTSLRMDPNDAETRYNLNLAMAMRQQQEEQQQQESGEDQNQEDSEEQEKQDGESQENQDGEKEDQQNPDDGEQDPEGEEGEDQQQGEGDENEEGQENSDPSEDPQEGEESSPPGDPEASPEEPQEGKIQAADAERILDMLERNEAALRAKLQAQENAKRNKGKKTKIEKDW